jgi:hypothetical protein
MVHTPQDQLMEMHVSRGFQGIPEVGLALPVGIAAESIQEATPVMVKTAQPLVKLH